MNEKEFSNSSEFNKIIEKINQPEIQNFLSEFDPVIIVFYENYCDTKALMSFDQFYEFYKNFSLFPDIVNLVQLKRIFTTLAEAYLLQKLNENQEQNVDMKFTMDNTNHPKKFNNKVCINFNFFLQSLAMTAMFFKFDNRFRDLDKILYLVERINQSKGLKILQLKSGKTFNASKDLVNFILLIREKYPEFYKNNNIAIENKKPTNFDELFDEEN